MGIGNFGFSEILLIVVMVLVFFGPQRMPEIARGLGKAMREFRKGMNEVKRELEQAGLADETSVWRPDTTADRPTGTVEPLHTVAGAGPTGGPPPSAAEPEAGPERGSAAGAAEPETGPGGAAAPRRSGHVEDLLAVARGEKSSSSTGREAAPADPGSPAPSSDGPPAMPDSPA